MEQQWSKHLFQRWQCGNRNEQSNCAPSYQWHGDRRGQCDVYRPIQGIQPRRVSYSRRWHPDDVVPRQGSVQGWSGDWYPMECRFDWVTKRCFWPQHQSEPFLQHCLGSQHTCIGQQQHLLGAKYECQRHYIHSVGQEYEVSWNIFFCLGRQYSFTFFL